MSHWQVGSSGMRGSVKARHFVLASRDFYHNRAEERKRKASKLEGPHLHDPDVWSLQSITVKRLQSIGEAFDDDGSDFTALSMPAPVIEAAPVH